MRNQSLFNAPGFSLKPKLILAMLVLGLLPLVTAGFIAYRESKSALITQSGAILQAQAKELAMAIDKEMDVRYRETIVQSANPIMVEDEFGLTIYFGHFIKMLEVYDAMWIADLEGKILSSHGPGFKRIGASQTPLSGKSALQEPCFRTVIDKKIPSNHAHFGGFKVHPWAKLLGGGDGRALIYSAPVTGRMGDVERVLCQFASWDRTIGSILRERQVLKGKSNKNDLQVFVMDQKGLVWDAYHREDILKVNLLKKQYRSAQFLSQGKIGFLVEKGPEGKQVLVGYAPTKGSDHVPNPGLGVLVMSELGAATASTGNLKWVFFVVGCFGGLFILASAWFISTQLVSPLQHVVQDLDKLAQGDLRGSSGKK